MADKALAAYRKARAVELALAGHDYDTIAKEVGYANRGTAWRAVQRALKDREVAAVDAYRAQQVMDLDDMQSLVWHAAMAGDAKAIRTVLRVIDRRCRVLGLA